MMSGATRILVMWSLHPSVLVGLAALTAVFVHYDRRERRRERAGEAPSDTNRQRRERTFVMMVVATLVALNSPLDALGDGYLFSAHMLQHLLLILAVAPLLVMSTPPELLQDTQRRLPGTIRALGGNPVVGYFLFVADVLAWHAPALYEATLLHEPIHVAEHLSFVATAALFWRHALPPIAGNQPRLHELGRMAYL
ncbi:MAG: cytochrome c oxidase assembly protein, partial [Chloroflexota bacterium]